MRDELCWEMDRLGHMGTLAQGYLASGPVQALPAAPLPFRLDVRR